MTLCGRPLPYPQSPRALILHCARLAAALFWSCGSALTGIRRQKFLREADCADRTRMLSRDARAVFFIQETQSCKEKTQ